MRRATFLYLVVWLLVPIIMAACRGDPSREYTICHERQGVQIDTEGYFVLNGVKTILLGGEEPPVWVAFPELQPYPEVVEDFIRLCRDACINLIVLYKWVPWPREFIEQLARAGIWVGIQVAEAKQPLLPFLQTGGAIGTLPDKVFEQEQFHLIQERVSYYASLPNVAFWWIGGEFIEPVFYSDGGMCLRALLLRYIEAIRDLDPYARPITCSQHIVEALLCGPGMGRMCLDLTDVIDFSWYTIATHMHLGDFLPGLPSSLNWQPILNPMEDPVLLDSLLVKIHRVQQGKAFYLGSWSTMSPSQGPCYPSSELTRSQWEQIHRVVPFSGGAYWNFGSHLQPSDFPHGLVELKNGVIVPTENMAGLGQAYAATSGNTNRQEDKK